MVDIKRTEHVLLAFTELRDGVDARPSSATASSGQARAPPYELGIIGSGFARDVATTRRSTFCCCRPNEGTPVSAIEALAAGRPVVACVSAVTLRRQAGGTACSPSLIRSAPTAALRRFAEDPELRERMGAAGRERVLRRYPLARPIDETDALYRSLLESVPSRSRIDLVAEPPAPL
jgi:glycosyltransferase involved in cell wall biosynthesis